MKQPLALHWSKSKPNFGDALSPIICEIISGRKIIYAKPSQCNLIAIGSLMQRVKESFFTKKIHIWGTGLIEEKKQYKSKHIYHAVRGNLTKGIIRNCQSAAVGDPGLLAELLIKSYQQNTKKYKIGFVEHYQDKNNPTVSKIIEKHPNTTRIDIYLPPLTFLNRIAECEVIFSSAMHGLIASDALNIPNAWTSLSNRLRGGDFKFKDYYSVFGLKAQSTNIEIDTIQQIADVITDNYRRPNIDNIKQEIYDSFPKGI